MAPSLALSEDQIRVSHVPNDCQMQIKLTEYGLSLDEMMKVTVTLDARRDCSAKLSHLEWLQVKYNPANLTPAKRQALVDTLTQTIKNVICHKVNTRKPVPVMT